MRLLSLPEFPLPLGDVKPPAPPWTTLAFEAPATGYLSVYLSEDISPLPIRHITRPHDNKSDPNLETGTYGLFSTCEQGMRASIVKNRAQYIFFLCRRGGRRVVTGYYRLAWKTEGVLGAIKADYALAADGLHFVDPPIPVPNLPEPAASVAGTSFRLYKRVDSAVTDVLLSALNSHPNALTRYLEEIDRVEQFQAFHSGYRYVSWMQKAPFSWEIARHFLESTGESSEGRNQSPTGFWQCLNTDCKQFVNNRSLLKRCPFCGAMGTLVAVAQIDESTQKG